MEEQLVCRWLIVVWLLRASLAVQPPLKTVRGVSVHRVPLRHGGGDQEVSPFCLAASSIIDLPSSSNFLATQVWPSARVASFALEDHASPEWTICEFGCGPGLPSLTAASLGCAVYATDLDEFGLELVKTAAAEQGVPGTRIKTQVFDLVLDDIEQQVWFDRIDLVVFSDVFECEPVAKGAAIITERFLKAGARVWTFAQSDRAQRELYLEHLEATTQGKNLAFTSSGYDPTQKLWLCDLDETKVNYG